MTPFDSAAAATNHEDDDIEHLEDGWDDDDDVDDLLDTSNEGGIDADAGINDDDDTRDDNKAESSTQFVAASSAPAAAATSASNAVEGESSGVDAWDDDDDLNFDDSWGDNDGDDKCIDDNEKGNGFPSATPAHTASSPNLLAPGPPRPPLQQQQQQQEQQRHHQQQILTSLSSLQSTDAAEPQNKDHIIPAASYYDKGSDGDNGWDDDDDDLKFDDDWGDNNKGIHHGDDNDEETGEHRQHLENQHNDLPLNHPEAKTRQLQQELERYLSSLHHMSSSINAVLEYEYNIPEKAEELIEYYSNRPALAEYTRSKELPRMDYQVVLPYGQGVETDKGQILAMGLLPDESLVARAANQSLLADMLQVLTGQDMLVRPQFLAICVAKFCKFTIHLEEFDNIVDCQARLDLSLPTETERLDLAEVFVSVVFAPDQRTIQYRIQTINVLLKDSAELQSVSRFLAEMDLGHLHNDSVPTARRDMATGNDSSADSFRDAFLENSQKLFSQSTEGFAQALQQMDSVINIKSKLKTISNFIPDNDVITAAEQEAMELAQARQYETEQQQHRLSYFSHVQAHQGRQEPTLFPRSIPLQPPAHPDHGNPPPSFQKQSEVDNESRPKSILGGFFKTLAKALPDEDPSMYDPTTQETPRNALTSRRNDMPLLYRRDDESFSPPQSHPAQEHQSPPPMESSGISQSQISECHLHQKLNYDRTGDKNEFEHRENLKLMEASLQTRAKQMNASTEPMRPEEGSRSHARMVAHTHPLSAIASDGWDDDMDDGEFDLDVSAEDTITRPDSHVRDFIPDGPSTAEFSPPHVEITDHNAVSVKDGKERARLVIDMTYNKEDDLVETRKRWMNPRPQRPYIIE